MLQFAKLILSVINYRLKGYEHFILNFCCAILCIKKGKFRQILFHFKGMIRAIKGSPE